MEQYMENQMNDYFFLFASNDNFTNAKATNNVAEPVII